MSVMRTSSGLSNFHHFINAEIIVYIEGQDEKLDKFFYENLIGIFTDKRISFIPKGSSTNVFEYLESIVRDNINNSFVIFDKDLTGLTISKRYQRKMLTTCFYSWENDLLDYNIVYEVFSDYCLDFNLRSKFEDIFKRELNKLDEIVITDALLQRIGCPILDKSKASFGVNFELNEQNLSIISDEEIERILGKQNYTVYQSDPVFNKIRNEFELFETRMYIQGHFYEYFCYKLVHCLICHFDSSFKKISQTNFMKFIVGKFSKSPEIYIKNEVYEHYQREFSRVFSEINQNF